MSGRGRSRGSVGGGGIRGRLFHRVNKEGDIYIPMSWAGSVCSVGRATDDAHESGGKFDVLHFEVV